MAKKNMKVHFSKKSDNWSTPKHVIDFYGPFDLDAAADASNHQAPVWFGTQKDGSFVDSLEQDWSPYKKVWCNPPYSKSKLFVKKAYEESLKGCHVTVLIPARVDTRYFHDYCFKASFIELIKGRLKFGNNKNSAPFPSCVIIFSPNIKLPQPILRSRIF